MNDGFNYFRKQFGWTLSAQTSSLLLHRAGCHMCGSMKRETNTSLWSRSCTNVFTYQKSPFISLTHARTHARTLHHNDSCSAHNACSRCWVAGGLPASPAAACTAPSSARAGCWPAPAPPTTARAASAAATASAAAAAAAAAFSAASAASSHAASSGKPSSQKPGGVWGGANWARCLEFSWMRSSWNLAKLLPGCASAGPVEQQGQAWKGLSLELSTITYSGPIVWRSSLPAIILLSFSFLDLSSFSACRASLSLDFVVGWSYGALVFGPAVAVGTKEQHE
eukprot:1142983-Pelagomonas_calceolata.AAC.3